MLNDLLKAVAADDRSEVTALSAQYLRESAEDGARLVLSEKPRTEKVIAHAVAAYRKGKTSKRTHVYLVNGGAEGSRIKSGKVIEGADRFTITQRLRSLLGDDYVLVADYTRMGDSNLAEAILPVASVAENAKRLLSFRPSSKTGSLTEGAGSSAVEESGLRSDLFQSALSEAGFRQSGDAFYYEGWEGELRFSLNESGGFTKIMAVDPRGREVVLRQERRDNKRLFVVEARGKPENHGSFCLAVESLFRHAGLGGTSAAKAVAESLYAQKGKRIPKKLRERLDTLMRENAGKQRHRQRTKNGYRKWAMGESRSPSRRSGMKRRAVSEAFSSGGLTFYVDDYDSEALERLEEDPESKSITTKVSIGSSVTDGPAFEGTVTLDLSEVIDDFESFGSLTVRGFRVNGYAEDGTWSVSSPASDQSGSDRASPVPEDFEEVATWTPENRLFGRDASILFLEVSAASKRTGNMTIYDVPLDASDLLPTGEFALAWDTAQNEWFGDWQEESRKRRRRSRVQESSEEWTGLYSHRNGDDEVIIVTRHPVNGMFSITPESGTRMRVDTADGVDQYLRELGISPEKVEWESSSGGRRKASLFSEVFGGVGESRRRKPRRRTRRTESRRNRNMRNRRNESRRRGRKRRLSEGPGAGVGFDVTGFEMRKGSNGSYWKKEKTWAELLDDPWLEGEASISVRMEAAYSSAEVQDAFEGTVRVNVIDLLGGDIDFLDDLDQDELEEVPDVFPMHDQGKRSIGFRRNFDFIWGGGYSHSDAPESFADVFNDQSEYREPSIGFGLYDYLIKPYGILTEGIDFSDVLITDEGRDAYNDLFEIRDPDDYDDMGEYVGERRRRGGRTGRLRESSEDAAEFTSKIMQAMDEIYGDIDSEGASVDDLRPSLSEIRYGYNDEDGLPTVVYRAFTSDTKSGTHGSTTHYDVSWPSHSDDPSGVFWDERGFNELDVTTYLGASRSEIEELVSRWKGLRESRRRSRTGSRRNRNMRNRRMESRRRRTKSRRRLRESEETVRVVMAVYGDGYLLGATSNTPSAIHRRYWFPAGGQKHELEILTAEVPADWWDEYSDGRDLDPDSFHFRDGYEAKDAIMRVATDVESDDVYPGEGSEDDYDDYMESRRRGRTKSRRRLRESEETVRVVMAVYGDGYLLGATSNTPSAIHRRYWFPAGGQKHELEILTAEVPADWWDEYSDGRDLDPDSFHFRDGYEAKDAIMRVATDVESDDVYPGEGSEDDYDDYMESRRRGRTKSRRRVESRRRRVSRRRR